MIVYLIGSLRNPEIPKVAKYLRTLNNGIEVFDDWHAAGELADTAWQEYETARGHRYKEAIKGHAAKHVFEFDYHHLCRADVGILVMPAGRSGHLELGWLIGRGKPGYVLFDTEPERFDQMYQFCTNVFFNVEELGEELSRSMSVVPTPNKPA